jgi:glucose/mannose-6-phosphate isomerase
VTHHEHELVDLNDSKALAKIDSENVLGAVEKFAAQCEEAWRIGIAAEGLPSGESVDSIVVLGMGGSGVSGDVVQAVVEPRLPFPFRVIKSYGPLPEWIGRNTLVFAVSYSGSTEETVAAMEEAHQKGARVVAISSGGPLAELAAGSGCAHVSIPTGLQPRASLGYLTLPILAVLEKMGLLVGIADDVVEAIEVLGGMAGKCKRRQPTHRNPAKGLAHSLLHKVPIVYGAYGVTGVAAMRFKCDLNEYGKIPAFWNYFPELNHNEIVGWEDPTDVGREHFVVVLLRDDDEHPRVALRYEITKHLIQNDAADVIEVRSEGKSALARILSLIFVTQLAAIYTGLQYGIDPGPVEVIQKLKAQLAERS